MMQRRSGLPLLGAVALAAAGLAMAGASGEGGSRALTQDSRSLDPAIFANFAGHRTFADPSRDSQMGFTFPTEVREILVKVGDPVKQGDTLIKARDSDALAAVAVQQLRADSRLQIDAVENALALARVEFAALERLKQEGGGSTLEYDRAENAVKAAEIDLQRATESLEEQQLQLQRLEADLERYYLVAPYDGVVQDVMVSEGDSTNESRPALRLVKIDPLHLRPAVLASDVRSLDLKVGDPAWAVLDLPEHTVREGTVIAISPVTESGTQRLIVKVEVPNPEGVTAGILAWVRFEAPEDPYWRERMAEAPAHEQPAGGDGS